MYETASQPVEDRLLRDPLAWLGDGVLHMFDWGPWNALGKQDCPSMSLV